MPGGFLDMVFVPAKDDYPVPMFQKLRGGGQTYPPSRSGDKDNAIHDDTSFLLGKKTGEICRVVEPFIAFSTPGTGPT